MIYLLQLAASMPLFLFGIQALQVLRRTGPARRDRAALAWSLTAAYFLVGGGYSALHALAAAAGFVLGVESPFYGWVGSWAIEATLARGVVSVVFAAMLLALMVVRRRAMRRMVQSAPWVMAATAAVGTAVALQVPFETDYQHAVSTALAVMNAATAILVMGALLAAVLNDGMDQLLWLALSLYALKETVNVSQMAVLAWWSVAPYRDVLYIFYATGAVLGAGMCFVGARRLRKAGAGQRVPALFERLYTQRRSPVS